jgi:hypothetical protein
LLRFGGGSTGDIEKGKVLKKSVKKQPIEVLVDLRKILALDAYHCHCHPQRQ